MKLITVILIGVGVFLFGMLWRARIRKSKMNDPDFARRDAIMKENEDKE